MVHEHLIAREPLLPLSLWRNRSVTGANVISTLQSSAIFAMFYSTTLYQQQVLHYSALRTGLAYVPLGLSILALMCATVVTALLLLRDDGRGENVNLVELQAAGAEADDGEAADEHRLGPDCALRVDGGGDATRSWKASSDTGGFPVCPAEPPPYVARFQRTAITLMILAGPGLPAGVVSLAGVGLLTHHQGAVLGLFVAIPALVTAGIGAARLIRGASAFTSRSAAGGVARSGCGRRCARTLPACPSSSGPPMTTRTWSAGAPAAT